MLRSRCCTSLSSKSHQKLVYEDSILEEIMGEHKKIKLKNWKQHVVFMYATNNKLKMCEEFTVKS